MKTALIALFSALAASLPAQAATGPFLSLYNTNLVVLIAFVLFIGVILYFRVPRLVGGLLDKQIESIRAELDEAASLRKEAEALLERCRQEKQEAAEKAKRIVAGATEQAADQVEYTKVQIQVAADRRVDAAMEQIAIAEQAAVTDIRFRAAEIAAAAAGDVIAARATEVDSDRFFAEAIRDVRLNLS